MKKYKVIHMGMSYEFEAHAYTINNNYGDCYEFFIEKDTVRRAVAIVPKKHTVILVSSDIDIKVLNSNVNILND